MGDFVTWSESVRVALLHHRVKLRLVLGYFNPVVLDGGIRHLARAGWQLWRKERRPWAAMRR